ncbi:bifunctional oligoribonuclease/PAP phosphatase NrnA [Candidatus Shapirobacteria bacterium]|jgi:phosphoesterase RecJ-like protein|nr:bifunctional oligoribonuclease/PAP phosphatase NrnA [Candidatus Shapirobacteria bacterium]HQI13059.1 bifunctional oligoribonuclease/PAP phosphatase NrnA [Candidatus Woesebacteria bacterium]
MNNIYSQINSTIDNSQHILLHLHPSPDADSVGSALAFYHYLKSIKKKVTLITGDSRLSPSLSHLPGAKKIITKNFFDLDLNKFDLFIILDSSAPDQISKLAPVVFPETMKTIVIDHHVSNASFGDLNLIDIDSPATCQIVYHFFKDNYINITQKMAACLLAGIYTDTGGFKYPPTSSETFMVAADLSKIYPSFTQMIFEIENNDNPENLRFLGKILSQIETYFNNHVAIASISLEDMLSASLSPDNATGGIANMLKSVVGWDIAISMVEVDTNKINVSFRTRNANKYDVSKIALATGFGGGHRAASGATIPLSLHGAKKLVLDTIKKLYPNL